LKLPYTFVLLFLVLRWIALSTGIYVIWNLLAEKFSFSTLTVTEALLLAIAISLLTLRFDIKED